MFRKSAKTFSKRIYIPLSLFAESFEVASCLPSCHFPVRLLCAFPVWCFPQQQGLNHFLGSFRISVLLCLPHSSLCTCLFSIICPFVPISLFSVFFREQTISENMLCYLPCISLFPFHWQKPHGCLLVTSLTGSRLFCVTAAAVQGAARRKKEGKPVLSSWQVFC